MPALSIKIKLIIAGAVILLLTILFVIFYRKGKNAGATDLIIVQGNEDTGGVLASESEIKTMAGDMYKDMEGYNYYGHNIGVFEKALTLSDTDLTRLYNEFNMKYYREKSGTLVNWVTDEQPIPGSQWSTIRSTLLSRFAKLNFL